jgi:tetratricopeptide (TPR) repeat protein
MIEAARRYDGYIVQSTGDGIFALFGAPLAHEDHPQRALYAALRMQEELRRYSARIVADGGSPIQCRVGTNTGEVVVRSIATGEGHTEYTPIGHTTNLASRMQAVAPVGSIAVSDTTRHWCEGYFAFRSLGPTRLRGVQAPIEVHEVTGLGPLRTRLQRAVGRGLTKFVGRETELKQMKDAAELARNGHGQMVAAIGDPGVGKSRLLHEFKVTSQTGWKVLETVSVSHGRASAYLPVIELLRSYFEILPEDDERKRREKIAGKIVMLDRALEDAISYLFALFGITEGDDPQAQIDPHFKQRRTLDAIKRVVLRESLNQPLMVIFEDLHCLDNESQMLLNLLVDSIGTARILLLVNYRPEYHHEWGNKSYYTQLRLHPLGNDGAEAMLDALLSMPGSEMRQPFQPVVPLDSVEVPTDLTSLKRLVLGKTEGNPFFIEEMVQELFEDGVLARNGTSRLAKPLSELRLPATVQAVLASRIDRLRPPEKELLQTLSVIGREFSQSLIARVVPRQADDLTEILADLQLAEFIYEQPAVSDIEYTFKHALTQEVAYNSILLERRKQIHERAAQAIEALFEASLSDHYADLARHYVRSGNVSKAINYLHLVAQQAISRSAYSEASAQLTEALGLLRTQEESAERDRTEIALVASVAMYMGMGLMRGLETSVGMLERALQLTERIADASNRLKILEFLAINYSLLADQLRRARALNRELLTIAERVQDLERVGLARSWLGWVSMHEGDFPAALQELDEAYRISAIPSLPHRLRPINWRVHSRAFASFALWVSGYPTSATERVREAFEVVRGISAPPAERITACWWSGNLYLLLRQLATAQRFSDEATRLAAQHGLLGLALGNVPLEAWVFVQRGQIESGLSRMLHYKTELVEHQALFAPWLFVALANACLATGRGSEGIGATDEGLALCRSSGVRLLESELHRLKGELLLNDGNDEAAAKCFRDAIDLARHQSAKSWELRSSTSLAQLLAKQGHHEEARAILADIYNWFTEGFDTADLKDAKALLDELSA